MNSLTQLPARLARSRFQLPVAVLIAFLQRTPAVRVFALAEEAAASSPLGAVLKSAIAAAASLGAVHSLAGATVLVPSQSSPVAAKVGTPVPQVAFTVSNTINIASWKISGTLPPGLALAAVEDSTKTLAGPGMLDATVPGMDDGYGGMLGGISSTTPVLSGTPTAAGNYTFTLQAYEFAGLTGLASNSFDFTINVAAGTVAPQTSVAPSFTAQPQSPPVAALGTTVTLTAAASGTPAPTFQWNKNGTPIPGATSSSLVLSAVSASDAANYTVTITNSAGTVTSTAASVTVNPPVSQGVAPLITQASLAQTVVSGATVVFSVTVTGTPAPTFQWRRDGVDISGATSATLVLSGTTGATAALAGSYSCLVSNSAGSVTSNPAALSVITTNDPGRISNLSVLTDITASAPNFTVATVIGPATLSGTKPLVVRAVGPGLGALGYPGTISDPQLALYNAGNQVAASNDNWGGGAALTTAMASVGAFPIASSSLDAVVNPTGLVPGNYSVLVSGVGSATGNVIAEIYDAAANYTPSSPRLINVSVLKPITSGGSLSLGFSVKGATATTLLIRVIGPGLAAVGVTSGTLGDPQLTLYDNSTGAVIAANDDWGVAPQLVSAGSRVNAFSVGSAATKDAMLLITLPVPPPQGAGYTVKATGNGGTSGYAIIEAYEVP